MTTLIPFPICTFDALFHVGTLDPAQKSGYNFEGQCGLSVTTEPDAWRQIARGKVAGDLFTLTRTDARFIDVNQINDDQRTLLIHWGLSQGFIIPVTRYGFTYFDDELDQDMSWFFDTPAEAETEAEGEHEIVSKATYALNKDIEAIVGALDYFTGLLLAYCLQDKAYDGLYWHTHVDVLRYCAPRGIILNHQLRHWDKQPQAPGCPFYAA